MPPEIPIHAAASAIVTIVTLFVAFVIVLWKLIDARFEAGVARTVLDAVARQRDRESKRADAAEKALAVERADAERAAQTRGDAVLELAHRLEHAEQSVREGTARAVRDHNDYQALLREAMDIRAKLAATADERDRAVEKWRRAAEVAVDAETRCAHLGDRLAALIAAVRLAANKALTEWTPEENCHADVKARRGLDRVMPLPADMRADEPGPTDPPF